MGSRRRIALAALLALCVLAGCISPSPPGGTSTTVMGSSRVSAQDMIEWFHATSAQPYRATIPVDYMVLYFVGEGNDEGVRGDIAFVQAIWETGWFSFPSGGTVSASYNNFGGMGAGDGTVAWFPDAATGVRAHIQHLRAYADATATVSNLAHPLVDPRFTYVTPKGKAPDWKDMGNGNWAADPRYPAKIIGLYNDLRDFAGLPPV